MISMILMVVAVLWALISIAFFVLVASQTPYINKWELLKDSLVLPITMIRDIFWR